MSTSVVIPSGVAHLPFDVAAHFTKQAKNYDKGCEKVNWDPAGLFADTLRRFGNSSAGPLRVVDLGPGTGVIGIKLKQQFSISQVIGVDLAEGMLPVAKNRAGIDHGVRGDISRGIPLQASFAHAVTLSGVLDFIPQTEVLAREVSRILKPGGIFIGTFEPLGTPNTGLNSIQHDPQTLGRDFARAGLTVKAIIDLPGFYKKPGKNPAGKVVDNQLLVAHREL